MKKQALITYLLDRWSHHPMTALSNAQIVAEMMYTSAIIYKNTGLSVKYFRPPYGDIDDRVRGILNALGFRIVFWGNGYTIDFCTGNFKQLLRLYATFSYDSTDADVSASTKEFVIVENIIRSWFNTVPGNVSFPWLLLFNS